MDLVQKLSEIKVDTSLFRSTKTMGAAKESKREQMRRALLEEKFGINMEENAKILYEERDPKILELSQTMEGITGSVPEKTNEAGEPDVATEVPENRSTTVGSGLKRPLESDANGQPIVKKIRKSREVREERLMATIETIERQKEHDGGDLSADEEEDDEEMDFGNDDTGEEWGGILDSSISEGTEDVAIDTDKKVNPDGNDPRDNDREDEEDEDEDGDDNDDSEEENELVPRLKRGRSEKANAFKEWALAQRKKVMNDGDPLGADRFMPNLLALKPGVTNLHVHVPRTREEDMTPPPELQVPTVEREVRSNGITRPPK